MKILYRNISIKNIILKIAEDDSFLIDLNLAITAIYLNKVCLKIGKKGLSYFRVARYIISSLQLPLLFLNAISIEIF